MMPAAGTDTKSLTNAWKKTNGHSQDIGPTVSHKMNIIKLFLKGYEHTEIEQRTRHTGESIKRYISGFS